MAAIKPSVRQFSEAAAPKPSASATKAGVIPSESLTISPRVSPSARACTWAEPERVKAMSWRKVVDGLLLALHWLHEQIPMSEDCWAYTGGFRLSEAAIGARHRLGLSQKIQ